MESIPVILEPATQHEIVRKLIEKLQAFYVFPEIAAQICVGLQKHLDAGEYDDITEGNFFALALTMHLQEVNHDQHLWVRWQAEPLPDDESPLHHLPEWQEKRKLAAMLDNYGLHRVERLPGNVGYLDIREFHRTAWGSETAIAAMAFLAHAGALIVDLRRCRGGAPGMVALISSYLFGEEPIHLNSLYWREEDITQQYWTLPYVPGDRFGDKPVYVLTSKETFSGGEEFANNLKTRQRATLVGETTGGGAHPGAYYRLHAHFEAFIPVGRAINPITGTNWEGSGVTPDIAIPQSQAFQVAYQMALQSILASLQGSPSAELRSLAQEAQKALEGMGSREHSGY